MSRPGPATPQHRSSTPTPAAIPARRANERISDALMKLSCSANSPGGYADMRARRSARANTARSFSSDTAVTLAYDVRTSPGEYAYTSAMRTRGRTLAAAAIPAGLLTGMIVQLLLLTAVAGTVAALGVSLSPAGWLVGIACGLIVDAALAHGLTHYRVERLTAADRVTLTRATLAACVAALVATSFIEPLPTAILVSLAATALALDAVDGWIARRTSTARALGAHFDAEVDAFLILILSVYVARSLGAWVLAIGAARYAFLAAGWLLPWMREPLPPRHWRKVVAATQGIVLTVAAARVLPPAAAKTMVAAALLLLAESFGRDIQTLRSNRPAATTPARS